MRASVRERRVRTTREADTRRDMPKRRGLGRAATAATTYADANTTVSTAASSSLSCASADSPGPLADGELAAWWRLLTIVVCSSPVPANPDTSVLRAIFAGLATVPDLPRARKLVHLDGPQPSPSLRPA